MTTPAPVRSSAITLPGSGIEVELLTGVAVYMLKVETGLCIGSGADTDGTIGAGDGDGDGNGVGSVNSGIGSGVTTAAGDGLGLGLGLGLRLGLGLGEATIGSGVGAGEATIGSGVVTGEATIGSGAGEAVVAVSGAGVTQALEKFPGPHTSTAVAGGATAR